MATNMEALIKEITIKHGITVGRDDPIFILQTLNARLMEDNAKAQQDMLNQFKEEMEGIALRWESDAKDKSERILNASLKAGKESMAQWLHNSASTTATCIKREVDESLLRANNSLRKSEKIGMFNLAASALTFLAVCILITGLLFQ